MSTPELWLNGRQITGRSIDRAPVLAPVTLDWGADSHVEQPKPADLKFTILFRDTMADIPDLVNGAQVELIDPYANRPIFVGAIRNMSSKPSDKLKGALEVSAHCTDYTADLESLYISTDWPSSVNRPTQLRYEFIEQGWTVSIPDDPTPSAELKLNSIKLMTALERFITRWRGHRYDTSWRDKITGELHKQVGVFKGNARRMRADKLTTNAAGLWSRRYTAPLVEGEYSPILNIPADNILLDPEWTQEVENCVTIVNLSTTGMGDDGFSTLTERTYKAAPEVLGKYGHRPVEVETDLLNSSDWAACAAEWMNDDSPWNVSDLTVRDTDLLDPQVVADLLAMVTRYKTLVIVTGILPNRPDPGPTDLRSYLLGGTYTWTGKKWEMSLRMERTITKLDGAGDWWTCERVAASETPAIADATCLTVGNELTVADFLFIGEPYMPTTPLGIPTPADSTKISQLAATQRTGFNKVDEILQGGITTALEEIIEDAANAGVTDAIENANLVKTTDDRLAQPTVEYEDFHHAITDPTGRMAFGVRSTAEIVAPAGLETPLAGQPFRTPYGFGIADPAGHISELRVGTDGLFPDDVLEPVAQRMARFLPGASGVRTAGVALTIPDSTTPTTTHNDVSCRLPVLLGARAGRWRAHIANTNDKSGTAYAGALSFTGVFIGKHQRNAAGELTGQFDGTPRQIAGPFTSPANGSDWVSDMIEDYPLDAQQDYLLAYGYTSAAQENYLAYAGGWQSSSAADVDAANPTLTQTKLMPLDVWIEVEVEASTKIIAYAGDSLTGGIRSTLPVYDSWPARHAVANGAIHTMYSHGGSEPGDWLNANNRKWTKFASLSKPDAMVIAHGNNNIFRGATLESAQADFLALSNLVRSMLTQRIYAATVLPRLTPGAAAEPVRKAYNEWLLTTVPAGTQAVFDFATAIDDGTGVTDPRWRSEPDNFHLNTAGYSRCFQQINAPLA